MTSINLNEDAKMQYELSKKGTPAHHPLSVGGLPSVAKGSQGTLKSSVSTGGAMSNATSYFYPLEPPPYRVMDEDTYEILLDHCKIRPLKPGLEI